MSSQDDGLARPGGQDDELARGPGRRQRRRWPGGRASHDEVLDGGTSAPPPPHASAELSSRRRTSTRRSTRLARARLSGIESRGMLEVDASGSCIDGTDGAPGPRHGGGCARPQGAHPMARPGREWAACPSTDERPRPGRLSPGTGPPADRWWSFARDRRRVRSARCPADAPRGRLTPRHRARRSRRSSGRFARASARARPAHVTTPVR